MAISYMPLERLMYARGVRRTQLEKDNVIGRNTISKFRRKEYVSLEVIDRLCAYFDCPVQDIIEYVKE